MAKECEICGKKAIVGHKVSHSNIKTKKRWYPNLSLKKLLFNGIVKKVKICTSCLKTYTKKQENFI